MKIQRPVILFVFLLVAPSWLFGQERRAFRLLEKKDYGKLNELLTDMISKDSVAPGAYFIKSLSFSEKLNPDNNIDSAYRFILTALDQYPAIDEKEQGKLSKAGIDSSHLLLQKKRVESLAFDKAKYENSVDSYNHFINQYPQSTQIEEAHALRDKVAFEEATRKNTYKAYLDFIKKYPDARQIPEAKKRYDLLIYREFTRDSTLQSYELFARNFPTSEHWEEAVKNIFKLSVVRNDPASYRKFIKNYPLSATAPIAAEYLFYTAGDSLWFLRSRMEDIIFLDSLKKIFALDTATIFPVYENNLYGFMDGSGREIISPRYSKIDQAYLCGSISAPYLTVWNGNDKQIISRDGGVIYKDPFYSVENLNYGFIKLSRDAKYGIIHQSGFSVLPFEFRDAGLVGNILIKAKKERGWALYTLTGIKLTDDIFDEVEEEGDFLVLERFGRLAVTNLHKVLGVLNHENFSPEFKYDDALLIDDDHILVTSGDEEGILNDKLEFTVPLNKQHFYAYRNGWIVSHDSLYDIYDSKFLNISGSGLKDVTYKGNWITGNIRDKWILYYNYAPVPDVFLFDSVAILSENYVYAGTGNKHNIIFRNYAKLNMDHYSDASLVPRAQMSTGDDFPGFLMLTKRNRVNYFFNPDGKYCFSTRTDDIKSLGDRYFLIRKNKKYGLLNLSGKEVLRPVYDGIAGFHEGFVTIFSDRKFGLANPDEGVLIKPEFTSAPEPFGNEYFMVKNGDNIGVVDKTGNMLLDTEGDQVRIWNDTSFMVHTGDQWKIFGKTSGNIFMSGLVSFREISANDDKKFYLAEKDNGFGVLGSKSGPLINLTFTDIVNIGFDDRPLYFAEKYIPEADLYIVIYYSHDGKLLKKQVFSSQEYSKIYCH